MIQSIFCIFVNTNSEIFNKFYIVKINNVVQMNFESQILTTNIYKDHEIMKYIDNFELIGSMSCL